MTEEETLRAILGQVEALERISLDDNEEQVEPTGRPMKGWGMVEPEGFEDDDQWKGWIKRATKLDRMVQSSATTRQAKPNNDSNELEEQVEQNRQLLKKNKKP